MSEHGPATGRLVRAAVVQAAPVAFDREATLDRVAHWTAAAAQTEAELVVFPEAFVSGYPKGADFGAVVGSRSAEGREWFRRYHDSGVDVPGPAVHRLGEIAADNDVHLVIGVIERTPGTLYCTVPFFAPDGRVLGTHRKLMPTAMERLIWGFGDGSTLTVVPASIGRIGAVICWENYMPQLRLAMYGQGIELYCAPTVDDRETWLSTMRHIALEGRCFVLSASQYVCRSDYPTDYPVATGAPGQPLVDTASGYGVDMPWQGGRIYFELDKDVPGLHAVLMESAKIVGPLTDWHEILGKLEEAFKERPVIIDVFGGRTHGNQYANKASQQATLDDW